MLSESIYSVTAHTLTGSFIYSSEEEEEEKTNKTSHHSLSFYFSFPRNQTLAVLFSIHTVDLTSHAVLTHLQ